MSLKDLKITSYQDSVSALPDYPSDAGITAAQLKEIFDGRTDKEIKEKHNGLVDELVAKFGLVEVDIADAVENHNQDENAHDKIITPIQTRIAEIIGEIAKIYEEIDDAENLISGTGLILTGVTQELQMHEENRKNPHNVTAEQIGLGRVDNTPDSDKSVAYALNAELDLLGNVIHEHYATKDEVGDVDLSGFSTTEEVKAMIDTHGLPSMFVEERKRVVAEAQNTPADLRLVVFADPHSYEREKYAKYNDILSSGCIDGIMGLGDYQIYSSKLTRADTISKFTEILSYAGRTPNCFYAIGNHDIAYKSANTGTPNQEDILTKKELYDVFYRHNTSACFNESDSYGGYFYVDFNASKIRMIVLNTSDIYENNGALLHKYKESVMIQQPQVTWLVNTALDFSEKTTPADWSVIVCMHAYFKPQSGDMFAEILSAVKSGASLGKSWTFKRTLDDPNTSALNLLPIESVSNSYETAGVTIKHSNGVFTIKGTSNASKSIELVTKGEDYAQLTAGVSYNLNINHISGTVSANPIKILIQLKNSDGSTTAKETNTISGKLTFTADQNCTLSRFALNIATAGYIYTDYVFKPTLTAEGMSGDESEIITTISANKDFSKQGAVDVIGVLYGHEHLALDSESNGINFIQFGADSSFVDDYYKKPINGLTADGYYITVKGVKMGFTVASDLTNAKSIGYNNYHAQYGKSAPIAIYDENGYTIASYTAKPDKYVEGMTEISGFEQERTPNTVKTESCSVVSIDKDTREIRIVPYGTGFERTFEY